MNISIKGKGSRNNSSTVANAINRRCRLHHLHKCLNTALFCTSHTVGVISKKHIITAGILTNKFMGPD